MTEPYDKKTDDLINRFFPIEHADLNVTNDLKRTYIVRHKTRLRVLEELLIHKEFVEKNKIVALGFYDLISELSHISDETVSILCGSSKEYSFEIYIKDDFSKRIGYSLIKQRKKTESEILWEKSLGINHDT
ncbi:hypothetical protein [Ewingella americana]|uniref:hypothetical protein n=1 Tax=Ewingella americana TaxID=41202 RepID=UPI0012ADE49C|nr:hypothetical protein [Ewingella americana]MRT03798.1 hypothetical protein [Ewingella americana]